MTGFYIGVGIMLILALFILIRGMIKDANRHITLSDTSHNQIYQEQLAELERDLAAGTISKDQYDAAVTELSRSLLASEANKNSNNNTPHITQNRMVPIMIASILVPLITVPMYFYLGQPNLIPTLQSIASQQDNVDSSQGPSMEAMLEILAQKMEEDPNDVKGLMLLARSYLAIGKIEESIAAYEKLYALVGDDPAVLLSYAEALIMKNQGRVTGEPEAMIEKVLAIQPDNESGLILTGLAAEEQGNFDKAINNWNRVLPGLKDPQQIAQIEQRIAQLGGQIATDTAVDAPAIPADAVIVSISLADEITAQVKPTDTLFIFARATSGPPMPLAAVRKTVADLPMQVVLDDSMAMMPTLKISGFDSVNVSARISLSGQPTASSGDIEAESVEAIPGQDEIVELILNKLVP